MKAKRKKQKKQKKLLVGYRARDGWYEIVDTAEDAQLIQSVKETEGYRCFFRGPIGSAVIVEVPEDMPAEKRDALGQMLSAQGVSVLLVTDRIKFYRLRRASPAEEKALNASVRATSKTESGTPKDLVTGPVTDGDGACSDRREGLSDENRDTSHEGNEGASNRMAP